MNKENILSEENTTTDEITSSEETIVSDEKPTAQESTEHNERTVFDEKENTIESSEPESVQNIPEEISEDSSVILVPEKRRPSKKTIIISISSVVAAAIVVIAGISIRNAVISQQQVDAVISLINNIGEVSYSEECSVLISNASSGFNNLTEKQKMKVTNYNTLSSAYNTYQTLAQLSEYEKNLSDALVRIRVNVSFYIASVLDNVQKTWYNAIYKKYDEYNKGDYSDFNDALQAFYDSEGNQKNLENIKVTNDSLSALVSKLQNPPEQYKLAYESFTKLYGAYLPLYEEALNPTGSYNSFSSKINTLSTNYTTANSEMKAVFSTE